MLHYFLHFIHQHAHQQMLAFFSNNQMRANEMKAGNLLTSTKRIFNVPTFDFGMESWHALVIKGNLATNKDIQDDTEGGQGAPGACG